MLMNILQFLMSRGSAQQAGDPPSAETNANPEAEADAPAQQGASQSPLSGLIEHFMNRRQAAKQQQQWNQAPGRQPSGRQSRQPNRRQTTQPNPGWQGQQPRGMQRGQNQNLYGPMMPPMQGMPGMGMRSNNPRTGRGTQQTMQPFGQIPYGGYPYGGQEYGGGFGVPMMPQPNAGRGGSRGRSRNNPHPFPQPFSPYPPPQPSPYPQQNPAHRSNRNQRRNTPPYNPWPF